MQRVAPHQLVYRLFMIIDGDHYVTVIQCSVTAVTSQYQQRGRLLAAYIAAGVFARGERRHQSFSERCARALECPDHVIDDIVTCQAVPECDAGMTRSAACPSVPGMQVGSRVSGDRALSVDQCELPLVASGRHH